MKKISAQRPSAFTLIELLVVMGIIVLMGALVVPAVSGSLKGSGLTQASQTLLAAMNNAQQTAIARGQTMELRLFLTPDPYSPTSGTTNAGSSAQSSWQIHGVQLYARQTNPAGTGNATVKYVPVTKLEFFPSGIVVDRGTGNLATTLSSICDSTYNTDSSHFVQSSSSTDYLHPVLPRVSLSYSYYIVRFRADGSTSLDPNKSWFLTVHGSVPNSPPGTTDQLTSPPSNFFTVELDPVQGSTRTFRP